MDKRQEIYLGALLHDIGKFYQKADKTYWDKDTKLQRTTIENIDFVCPRFDNKFSHLHAIWTNDFFNIPEIAKKFNELKSNCNVDLDIIFGTAIYHHKPHQDKYHEKIVQIADCWSSASDREPKTEQYESENETKNFKNIKLESIWEHIFVNNQEKTTKEFGVDLKKLNIDNPFPEKFANLKLDYFSYWNDFKSEFLKIKTDSVIAFTETLTYLLKRFTWCITSSAHQNDIPNVSLFDHLKSTAAISQCLYDFFKEKKYGENVDKIKILENDYPLILFCGDITGIQNYIYNISATKAAMSLKGRSFYLQLLTDSIIQKIIDECEVTIGHVVYASGGKFYMVLPNIDKVIKSLLTIESDVIENLRMEKHGELYVCMDWIPFKYKNNSNKYELEYLYDKKDKQKRVFDLGDLWSDLLEKVSQKKTKKYQNQILNNFESFFGKKHTGIEEGGLAQKENICAITGEMGKMERLQKADKEENKENEIYVLPIVKEQIDLGKELKTADYFITFREPKEKSELIIKNYCPLGLKIHNHLFNKDALRMNESDFRFISSADVARVKRINDTDFLRIDNLKGNKASYGFTFYGGNKQAMRNIYEEKTFHELAGLDKDEKNKGEGFHKLGVLRMDIDNLGAIFKDGLKNKTFAAYSTLSFQLDIFFSGYLNTIRNKVEYKDDINIIYSGGDDVFAVGKWDKIIDFAEEIRNEFRKFVCNREDISISAGIALVGGKFPIAKAADLAGEAEHEAKDYPQNRDKKKEDAKKNAICFFGETISWENEFEIVKKIKNDLVEFKDTLSAGFRQKLRQFYIIKNKHKKDTNLKADLSYKWNCAYFIARYLHDKFEDKSKYKNEKDFLDTLKNNLFTNERYYDLAALAARWAELQLRTYEKK